MIVVSFERLPASSLGCYGSFAAPTPTFDLLAAQGLTFDNCFVDEQGLRLPVDEAELVVLDCTDDAAIDNSARKFRKRLRSDEAALWCRVTARTEGDAWYKDPLAAHLEYTTRADGLLQQVLGLVVEHDESRGILLTAMKGDPAAIRRERPLWLQSLCEEVTHIPLIAAIHDGPVGRCSHLAGPEQLASFFAQLHQAEGPASVVESWRDAIDGVERVLLNSTLASAVRTKDWFAIRSLSVAGDPAAEPVTHLYPQPTDRWLVLDQAPQYPQVAEELGARS